MLVSNCTISGNSGEGIRNTDLTPAGRATLTVTNSTISGNGDGGIVSSGDPNPPLQW